ncbi:MAG: phage tail protein, partial [Lachnospiraceae bacterium]|nr:phage tail protein [Lachnospiraceae bacterium]
MAELFSFNVGLDLERKPAVGFNFVLRVEALYDLPCKSVRAFSKANEYEYVQEGGVNDYVHMLRKPISQPFTFQVERYVAVNLLDPLTNGTDLVLPVLLMVNRSYKQTQIVRCYVFTGCTVTGKEYGVLDSEKSELLTETTTIAYQEMFCIDNPFAGMLTGSNWNFDGTSKAGSGTRSARHNDGGKTGITELDQGSMEARARKWMFTDGDSARAIQTEQEEETDGSQTLSPEAAAALAEEQKRLAYRGINQSAVTQSETTKDAMEE